MNKWLVVFAMLALSTGLALAGPSQSHTVGISVAKVTELGITDPGVVFSVYAPAIPGDPPEYSGVHTQDTYLHYTSIRDTGTTRAIRVSGADTNGLRLQARCTGTIPGTGNAGTGQGTVDLPAGSRLIDGVQSCYTGSGSTDGANVWYSLVIRGSTFGSITSGPKQIVVTYTLLDN